ncbi:hypothetical protein ACI6Q2_01145 [Chitinophagaceae bacterium LWZ2-11]
MKIRKSIDCWTQLVITLSVITITAIDNSMWFISYAIISSIQLLSVLFHHIASIFQTRKRKMYQYIVYGLLLIIAGCFAKPSLLLILYFLLFVIPILQAAYIGLCFYETYYRLKRPLAQLK